MKPGIWQLLIILLIVLLLFGAKKLPELGSAMGKTIKGFKNSVNEGKEEAATPEEAAAQAAAAVAAAQPVAPVQPAAPAEPAAPVQTPEQQ